MEGKKPFSRHAYNEHLWAQSVHVILLQNNATSKCNFHLKEFQVILVYHHVYDYFKINKENYDRTILKRSVFIPEK